MTYEELKISIDLNGYKNVLPKVGKTYFDYSHWFVVCDDGDCHLFDENGIEDDIKKVTEIYEDIIPKDIKKIIIPDSIMSIGHVAFFKCTNLTSVMIPDSVMSIGNYAFYNCSRLTSVIISNGVTSIGYHAFFDCNKLMNVIIDKPIEHVKSMENYPWGIEDESIIKCIQ